MALVNYEKNCFRCNQTIFFCPDVKREDDPKRMLALDERFTGKGETIPHNCPELNQQTNRYYYEPTQEITADNSKTLSIEQWRNKKPIPESTGENINTKKLDTTSNILVNRKEFDVLKNDVREIKELVQALIKTLNENVGSNNGGIGLLFKKASDLPTSK